MRQTVAKWLKVAVPRTSKRQYRALKAAYNATPSKLRAKFDPLSALKK